MAKKNTTPAPEPTATSDVELAGAEVHVDEGTDARSPLYRQASAAFEAYLELSPEPTREQIVAVLELLRPFTNPAVGDVPAEHLLPEDAWADIRGAQSKLVAMLAVIATWPEDFAGEPALPSVQAEAWYGTEEQPFPTIGSVVVVVDSAEHDHEVPAIVCAARADGLVDLAVFDVHCAGLQFRRDVSHHDWHWPIKAGG